MKLISPLSVKISIFVAIIGLTLFSCQKNTSARLSGGGGPNPNVQVFKDLQYGSNTDILGNKVQLKLDVYVPANAGSGDAFPLVFFVHGGGFIGGDKSSAATALESFAEQGFVGVSIDYRVDSSIDAQLDPCSVDTVTSEKTVYMSVQDVRAALRYMVANASRYHIDTSRIFLNGNSAGAITVLNSYFLTQNDFNAKIPGVQAQLGGINNADNNLTNTFSVIAIAANSGCLSNPNYITPSNAIPVIFFHGGRDSVIPIKSGHAYYCPNTLYLYGSVSLYNRLSSLGVPAVIHIDPTGGHGPYAEDFLTSNEICFFNSVLSRKVESGNYSGQQSSCH